MGAYPPFSAFQAEPGQQDQLGEGGNGRAERAGPFWGPQTGPNPTDKAKSGSKRSLLTDGNGTPLSIVLTGANRHNSQMSVQLVDKVPPVCGRRGRPRRRPASLFADRAYDAAWIREELKKRSIRAYVPKRFQPHGSGLGHYRWVVERTFAWLNQFRRLRIRYEKRSDIREAFLCLGCIIICWRVLQSGFC